MVKNRESEPPAAELSLGAIIVMPSLLRGKGRGLILILIELTQRLPPTFLKISEIPFFVRAAQCAAHYSRLSDG